MKRQYQFTTKILALGIAITLWVLFRTLRTHFCTSDPATNPYKSPGEERFLYSVWHDSMIIPAFAGKHPCTMALTSQHADGSLVAHVLKLHNIPAIRGSTNRISIRATRDLMESAAENHIVITPDGPRGPNRQMSKGIAFLASRTGRAVVPTAYSCSRCWRFKGSWTDLIIPKPFAKVFLLAGPPIYIPPGIAAEQLQEYITRIQDSMDQLDHQAETKLHPEPIPTC